MRVPSFAFGYISILANPIFIPALLRRTRGWSFIQRLVQPLLQFFGILSVFHKDTPALQLFRTGRLHTTAPMSLYSCSKVAFGDYPRFSPISLRELLNFDWSHSKRVCTDEKYNIICFPIGVQAPKSPQSRFASQSDSLQIEFFRNQWTRSGFSRLKLSKTGRLVYLPTVFSTSSGHFSRVQLKSKNHASSG